jgi:hypothetical protein
MNEHETDDDELLRADAKDATEHFAELAVWLRQRFRSPRAAFMATSMAYRAEVLNRLPGEPRLRSIPDDEPGPAATMRKAESMMAEAGLYLNPETITQVLDEAKERR